MNDFIKILLFDGWKATYSKLLQATIYTNPGISWMIEKPEDISEENELHALWHCAARCLELAKLDPVNLMYPWMPIAMALQAVDAAKLKEAILNFIDVYNYQTESQGAKESGLRVAAPDQDGTEEGRGARQYDTEIGSENAELGGEG